MKQFIDNLIGRLEELRELHKELIKDGLSVEYHSGCKALSEDAIEIVNQLAEEYKNDISQEQYRNGYADGWHDCASTIQQSAPYQPKGE